MICDYLSGKTCTILEMDCFILKDGKKRRCAFSEHYYYLVSPSPGKPEAEMVKSEVRAEALERWKGFVKAPQAGQKDMTGIPLEKGVRSSIQRTLEYLGVRVTAKGKQLPSLGMIADCLVSKEGCPTSIISIKTWLSPEAIRETFAYAYLAKKPGQLNYKVFMVALNPIAVKWKYTIAAFKPYLDGIYSLSKEPYIDDLLEELKRIYV